MTKTEKSKKLDYIDKMYLQKKFFLELYRPLIVDFNDLRDNENIILCFLNKATGYMEEQKAFNNIDDLLLYLSKSKRVAYCETYFNLYTSATENRKKEDIKTSCFLAFDFDKGDFEEKGIDLNIDYIQSKFLENGLYYNMLVNSGNGYHAYILIEPTTDLDLVVSVTKEIAKRLGSDPNACKSTQILRIPYTYNNKQLQEGIKKIVPIIYQDETPKRKNIHNLANKLLKKEEKIKTYKGNKSCMKLNDLITKPCEGTSRHEEFVWLYAKLLQLNTTKGQIRVALEKFQDLNKLEDYDYQVEYLETNGKPLANCKECKYKKECVKVIESDFEYSETDQLIDTTETTIKRCKKKGAKNMNGNMLVVYALLKVYYEGISQKEILEQLSKNKNKKPCMSKPTLIKVLNEMEQMELIEAQKEGRNKLYKLNSKVDETRREEYKFSINYACANMVIQGIISSEDLRLYCFMRYLHNVENRIGKKTGNVFNIRQTELAEKYGDDQGNISKAINRLLDVGILGIHYRGISSNNNREYYIYKLLM